MSAAKRRRVKGGEVLKAKPGEFKREHRAFVARCHKDGVETMSLKAWAGNLIFESAKGKRACAWLERKR